MCVLYPPCYRGSVRLSWEATVDKVMKGGGMDNRFWPENGGTQRDGNRTLSPMYGVRACQLKNDKMRCVLLQVRCTRVLENPMKIDDKVVFLCVFKERVPGHWENKCDNATSSGGGGDA